MAGPLSEEKGPTCVILTTEEKTPVEAQTAVSRSEERPSLSSLSFGQATKYKSICYYQK